MAIDTGGLLLAVVVTAAAIQDRDAAFRLLAILRNASHDHAGLGRRRVCRTPGDLGEEGSLPHRGSCPAHR
ncbi:hypothetical protein [Nonomuraea dietziae]|uniref:hypothetical protein n=1 Tax=Nonomuraea dietziae TaxID=65515 RepID=UPI0033ED1DE5